MRFSYAMLADYPLVESLSSIKKADECIGYHNRSRTFPPRRRLASVKIPISRAGSARLWQKSSI